jgi:uncharacterized protein YfiM (DUF2279 family)
MKLGSVIIALLFCSFVYGHSTSDSDSINPTSTSLLTPSSSFHKGRFIGVSSGIGATWAGSMIGLHQIWYSKVPKSSWNTFDDSKNWLQMDKVGHFYTAYKINALTSDLYKWSGTPNNSHLYYGLGVSFGFQTTLEFLDAHTEEWGWSWADFSANVIGSVGYTVQQIAWREERIIPKFSYHPTEFAAVRPNVLGSTPLESLLKDYNGQTYWLSFSPGTFINNSKIPKWACISVGYSAHEKLVGSESYYLDNTTGIEYNEKREFLLSLDIDLSKIPVKKPWLKTILKQLNYLKIPFPALILRDGKVIGHPLYF